MSDSVLIHQQSLSSSPQQQQISLPLLPPLPTSSSSSTEEKRYQNVCLGGTYDRLHSGHKLMLAIAAAAVEENNGTVTVGLTDTSMLHSKKLLDHIQPYETRAEEVRRFLMDDCGVEKVDLSRLIDPFGPSPHTEGIDAIVVSPETAKAAPQINHKRVNEFHLPVLDVILIGYVPAPLSLLNNASSVTAQSPTSSKLSSTQLRSAEFIHQQQSHQQQH